MLESLRLAPLVIHKDGSLGRSRWWYGGKKNIRDFG